MLMRPVDEYSPLKKLNKCSIKQQIVGGGRLIEIYNFFCKYVQLYYYKKNYYPKILGYLNVLESYQRLSVFPRLPCNFFLCLVIHYFLCFIYLMYLCASFFISFSFSQFFILFISVLHLCKVLVLLLSFCDVRSVIIVSTECEHPVCTIACTCPKCPPFSA